MRTLLILLLSAVVPAAAQTQVNKTVPVKSGQTLHMKFDYPTVKVTSWDKNEILITGEVSINGGESDEAFELIVDNSNNVISVRSEIKNMNGLPHRVTATIDGQKIRFRDKSEWRKYQDEHGIKASNVNMGVDLDVELEIKVPRNMETRIDAVYGMVEIKDFQGPLSVEATYGGIDIALIEQNVGELIAETNYGKIYSNLSFKADANNSREEDFHLLVSAKLGNGPKCKVQSQYGNVYLRKSQK